MRAEIGPRQERWLRLLETTSIQQGQGTLFSKSLTIPSTVCACALGIGLLATELPFYMEGESVKLINLPHTDLYAELEKALELRNSRQIYTMNDSRELSFPAIAKAIRACPRRFFREPI